MIRSERIADEIKFLSDQRMPKSCVSAENADISPAPLIFETPGENVNKKLVENKPQSPGLFDKLLWMAKP